MINAWQYVFPSRHMICKLIMFNQFGLGQFTQGTRYLGVLVL